MPFAYDDDQAAFAEAVTDTLRARCPMTVVRAIIDEPERWHEVWDQLVALDLPGLLVPEALGGVGLTPVDLASVIEAAGHFAAPVPLVATLGAFTPVVLAADEHGATTEIIARVIAGTAATVAPPPLDPGAAPSPRLRTGRLTGRCDGIPDASRAELIAVPATTEDGATVLVVGPAQQFGLRALAAMDDAGPVGRLELQEHEIGDALVLTGDFAPAWAITWVAAAAELVGLGSELIALSVTYARDRKQFGQAIGAFQGVKHQLADAHLAVERARSLTMYAAGLCSREGGLADAVTQRAAHQAKAMASEAGSQAARVAVQVHGGVGITREHDVSLMYLRARQLATLFGGADGHLARAAQVAGTSPAGQPRVSARAASSR